MLMPGRMRPVLPAPSKFLVLTVVQLTVLLAGAGLTSRVNAQAGKPEYSHAYHGYTEEIVQRGTQALKLCNALFVSGRTADQAYAQELAGIGTIVPLSGVEINQQLKAVAIGVGGADAAPAMRAAHREGLGCVVMSPDQTFNDIDKLPVLRMAAPPGDPATIAWPNGDLVTKKPLPSYINAAALDAAGKWTLDRVNHGGHKGQVTLSMLVIHGGNIIYEGYAPGVNMQTRTRTWSTGKSISSTVVGIAVGKGLLKLDEPLPFSWPPHEDSKAPDPRRKITLRHVLNMSSGLYPVDDEYEGAIGSHLGYFGGWNAYYHARDRGLIHEPGTVMNYENYDTLLLVAALRAALGDQQAFLEFPHRHLLSKIGMRNTVPGVDRFGNYIMSSQIYTNARDLGRLGLLYLNRGKWNGEQIIPESWVDFVRTPAPSTRESGNTYGGQWWLVPDSRKDLPQDAYSTSGARGQFTIVVPSYDLVIVRRGLDWRQNSPGRGLSNWDVLAEVLKAFPRREGARKFEVATESR
jgi:CubicO group peptidase (beta-lactamase class C family)